jgi:hypothetical protein
MDYDIVSDEGESGAYMDISVLPLRKIKFGDTKAISHDLD